MEQDVEDDYDSPERIRHAETPELAREALIDSVVLIFKSQVEVAFREQTAGHNALLLFVHLALQMMEEQLLNAFKELRAKQAEVQTQSRLQGKHDNVHLRKNIPWLDVLAWLFTDIGHSTLPRACLNSLHSMRRAPS